MNRRTFIAGVGATTAATAILPTQEPLAAALAAEANTLGTRAWLAQLGTTLETENDYVPEIEGTIPAALNGTLYRNGPGRFDRGGMRKTNVLDGDGMVQSFEISGGQAHYKNRFVRTEKFVKEEAAGRLQFATWTTRAPGGIFANIGGGEMKTQAGVTIYNINGHMVAIDETGPAYEVDAHTLETTGLFPIGPDNGAMLKNGSMAVKAHTKLDATNGERIFIGNSYGRNMQIHLAIHDTDNNLKTYAAYDAPKQVYIHDFIASENYVLVLLHPAFFNPLPFLSGRKSFKNSLKWHSDEATLVMIIPRNGKDAPIYIEAPGTWMWHALNAYEEGGNIIADYVGYDVPDHFLGKSAALTKVMTGESGTEKHPGLLHRMKINLKAQTLEDVVLSQRVVEFPYVDQRRVCRKHQVGYFTTAPKATIFHSGVVRINLEDGTEDAYIFPTPTHVGEGVLVASVTQNETDGFLLNVCLDGTTGRSFLAIFNAAQLANGPLARVWLKHHAPLSFHGDWVAA